MNKLFVILSLISLSVLAHVIEGTLVFKGSVKSKIVVNTVKTVCKLKIDKVTNLLEEQDSFGNPAYKIKAEISLSGSDFERNLSVKFEREVTFINLFKQDKISKVDDLKYFVPNEKITLEINNGGYVKKLQFPYQNQTITCLF